jgi:hypothetical protein
MPAVPSTIDQDVALVETETPEQPKTQMLDRIVESVRQDCKKAPAEYLDEVVARGYCGE